MRAVIDCVEGCNICKSDTGFCAYGYIGESDDESFFRREIDVSVVEVMEGEKRKYAILVRQPPNCEGTHRERLLFLFEDGLDSDEQQERGIRILRSIVEHCREEEKEVE